MPLIEVEITASKFNDLAQTLVSAAPIPIGVLNGLGPDRLIAAFTWDSIEVGVVPGGFSVPAGTITAREIKVSVPVCSYGPLSQFDGIDKATLGRIIAEDRSAPASTSIAR